MPTELWSIGLVLLASFLGSFGPLMLKKASSSFRFGWELLKNYHLILGFFFYGILWLNLKFIFEQLCVNLGDALWNSCTTKLLKEAQSFAKQGSLDFRQSREKKVVAMFSSLFV